MNAGVLSLSATIRAKEGGEAQVEAALLEVARWVAAHEPQTLAYHVGRETADRTVFTTFERFADESAMAAHNDSAAVARFVEAVTEHLAAPIEIRTCDELASVADLRNR
jgi:quinol monooxygenase YgiN